MASAMSNSSLAAAVKTHGFEKSVWVEFDQLAREVKPVNLGEGCPNFAPPDFVHRALSEVCLDEKNHHLHQYTRSLGHPRLVSVLSEVYSKLMNREIDPMNEVLVTVGADGALATSMHGLLNPGDEVIIIEPFYDCYVPQVKLSGGTPVFVPLRPEKREGVTSSGDWKLDPKVLAEAFNSKTRAIIVNTPHNPTGKVYTLEELTMIANLCKKYDVIAIMDEVYEWLTYDGHQHVRMAALPGMWERTVTIGSAGKTFCVTGWKTGWAIAPSSLLCGPRVIQQNGFICPTVLQEAVARCFEEQLILWDSPKCFFHSLSATLKAKRDYLIKILTDVGLSPIIPDGGFFILANAKEIMSKLDITSDLSEPRDFTFTKWLTRNRRLQGIPPSAFFSDPHKYIGEDYIRFCFIKV